MVTMLAAKHERWAQLGVFGVDSLAASGLAFVAKQIVARCGRIPDLVGLNGSLSRARPVNPNRQRHA